MFKGLGDIANLIKNAREMQQKVEEIKTAIAQTPIDAAAGGGLVRIKGRGDGVILSVNLDELTLKGGDKALLEDLILAAYNQFNQKVQEHRQEKMSAALQDLGLPAGFNFPL